MIDTNREWPLLRGRVAKYDAILMSIISSNSQQIIGRPEKIYSRRFEGPKPYIQGDIEFVGSPGHWGAVTLRENERALVFLGYVESSGRYYQLPWQGHFTVEQASDALIGIANWRLLENGVVWEPRYLAESAFLPDPAIPWRVAMPYNLLERHLLDELTIVAQNA